MDVEIHPNAKKHLTEGPMMSKAYTAANGQVITDEMIDTWCESYEMASFRTASIPLGGSCTGGLHSQAKGRQRYRSRFP